MEAHVKGTMKALAVSTALLVMTGCSSMVEIKEQEHYAQPKWYQDCAQSGSEGLFWWKEDFAYACGGGESRYFQAAEEQMYAIAMNNFAKRINGRVNSETKLEFKNETRETYTRIGYNVDNTRIIQHLEEKRVTFRHAGKMYTFVRLKMPQKVFDQLVAESQYTQPTASQ